MTKLVSLSFRDIANMTLLGDESFYRCEAVDAEFERMDKTIESLRRDLADPPADVQEAVLRKLNLWPPPAPVEPRDDLVHGERAEAIGLLRLAWGVCVNENRPALANEITTFIDRLALNRNSARPDSPEGADS
jgi:hypothetical protein